MSERLQVDPVALKASAFKTEMKANGETLPLSGPGFSEVAGDVSGLAALQHSLAGAQERWDSSGKRLSAELGSFGSALMFAASTVNETDEDAKRTFDAVTVY